MEELPGQTPGSCFLFFKNTMKHNYRIISALAGITALMLLHSASLAQTSPTISYQGELQSNGEAVNATDTIKILIYNVEAGGSPIYTETQAIAVQNGIFNMAIGSSYTARPTLDFTKQYYLAVSVNGAPELSPRSEVSFAPYAFRALNADTAGIAKTATVANGLSGGFVGSMNGEFGTLTLSGTNGITITNDPPNIMIGNNGVQSVNTAGGKVTLIGSGGTTIADTGTTITIHSQTFSGGTGIQAVQNSDSSITITNGSGPIATITLGHQNASSGQVLEWNGSAWKPATLSGSNGPDSIKNLQDSRDDGSSVYLGAGSGVNNSGMNSNVALGIGALHSNTTGNGNIALGDSTLSGDTTGSSNVAVGAHSLARSNGSESVAVGEGTLQNIPGGNVNTAIGYQSMNLLTAGSQNTACGIQAMSNNTSNGGDNSAFGYWSLYNNSGGSNCAFGWESMWHNLSGSFNSAFGTSTLVEATGSWNTAIGCAAAASNDSGWSNVAVGAAALKSNKERSNLVAIGDSALYWCDWLYTRNGVAPLDSATANTAVGSKALFMDTSGAYNTAMGYQSLYSNTIGYHNTAFGNVALYQNTSGNNNTAIGDNAGPTTSSLSNTTTLGSGAQATASGQVVLGNPLRSLPFIAQARIPQRQQTPPIW